MFRAKTTCLGLIAVCLLRTALGGEENPSCNAVDRLGMAKAFEDQIIALHRAGQGIDMKVLARQVDAASGRPIPLPEVPAVTGSFPAIYTNLCRSVLLVGALVQCPNCKRLHGRPASGFVAAPDGIVVTCCHVVTSSNALTLAAMDVDRKLYPVAEVLAADRRKDIAILRVRGLDAPPLRFGAEHPVGADVWVISHPGYHFYLLTRGIVSDLFIEHVDGRPVNRMSVTADFGVGSSGAPVFDSRGEVVGVAVSTQPVKCEPGGSPPYVQMVIRQCLPAEDVVELLRGRRRD